MWLIGLSVGQRMLGCCARVSPFSFISRLKTLWPSSRAKFNTCGARIPVCLGMDPSAFQQRPCSLSPHQVSFCWKSLGCWKRRKWQRKRRASTAASLMWCLAQPTCSGECRAFLSSNLVIPVAAAPGGTEHVSVFVAEKDDPEFSMAEQKRGSKEREFFIQRLIFLLSHYDLLSCTL